MPPSCGTVTGTLMSSVTASPLKTAAGAALWVSSAELVPFRGTSDTVCAELISDQRGDESANRGVGDKLGGDVTPSCFLSSRFTTDPLVLFEYFLLFPRGHEK